jgi:hypothetical protein
MYIYVGTTYMYIRYDIYFRRARFTIPTNFGILFLKKKNSAVVFPTAKTICEVCSGLLQPRLFIRITWSEKLANRLQRLGERDSRTGLPDFS